MSQRRYRHFVICALCCIAVALSACVERFDVVVVNHRDEPIVIVIGQFHSEGFTTTRPKEFSMNLLIGQQEISLEPKEHRTITFNSATGGFWLRWRLLNPLQEPSGLFTLDLIRDERSIAIN